VSLCSNQAGWEAAARYKRASVALDDLVGEFDANPEPLMALEVMLPAAFGPVVEQCERPKYNARPINNPTLERPGCSVLYMLLLASCWDGQAFQNNPEKNKINRFAPIPLAIPG